MFRINLPNASRPSMLGLIFLCASFVATTANANCDDPNYHWSNTNPQVNLRHVFCGEISGNPQRAKGYHSKVYSPATNVVTGTQYATNPVNGIYNARVNFINNLHKNSTFFPDACNEAQITASIAYAANNQTGPAQPWGVLGPSSPNANNTTYCLGNNGQPFSIRMGLINNNTRVNTAFPN